MITIKAQIINDNHDDRNPCRSKYVIPAPVAAHTSTSTPTGATAALPKTNCTTYTITKAKDTIPTANIYFNHDTTPRKMRHLFVTTTPRTAYQKKHQNQIKTKIKIKLQIMTSSPLDTSVDSNE